MKIYSSLYVPLVIFFCLIACTNSKNTNPEKIFEYEVHEGEITILNYIGDSEKVVIPEKINGLPVTAIGENAFMGSTFISQLRMMSQALNQRRPTVSPKLYEELKNNRITSIVMPDTIVTIGDNAFAYTSSLNNIIIPDSVKTIGEKAFSHSGLTEIIIPDSVETIGNGAFENNYLTSITIPNSVKTMGASVFRENRITSIVFPDSIMAIEDSTFYKNQLTDVIIPDSIISIGKYAFSENNLSNIIIPDSVKTIEEMAFYDNRPINITLPDNVDLGNYAFALKYSTPESRIGISSMYTTIDETVRRHYLRNDKRKMSFRIIIDIDNFDIIVIDDSFVELLEYSGNAKDVVIPESINNLPVFGIGNNAFNNKQITSVVISDSVEIIGKNAFFNNPLTSVVISRSVKTIGEYAFPTDHLTNLSLPDNVAVEPTSFFNAEKRERERRREFAEFMTRLWSEVEDE